jgi:hypothetical protein
MYDNSSFSNKSYNNVRSFGKDLSNIQHYQEAKHAYGDMAGSKHSAGPSHQPPKSLRVKSQIGSAAASQSKHKNLETSGMPSLDTMNKLNLSKDRRAGMSQEGRIQLPTRSSRDLAGVHHPASSNSLIFNVPQTHNSNNAVHNFFSNAAFANKEDEYQLRNISTKLVSEPVFAQNDGDVLMTETTEDSSK